MNRAFMYGESVFTTLRMVNGSLVDWSMHFERLKRGVEFVYGPFSENDWAQDLRRRLEAKCKNEVQDKVIRLTVYRDQLNRGLKLETNSSSDLKIHLSTSDLIDNSAFLRLKLRSCPVNERPHWWPSFLKAGNYLNTILAQRRFLKNDDDDLLFLSPEKEILSSSVANIFVISQNKLFTAPTGPNVLAGIAREKMLNVAKEFFSEVTQTAFTLENLKNAEAIFGSNSVRGLFLVDRVDHHELTYSQEFLDKFTRMRNRVLS